MRNVIAFMHVSLDGFAAGPNGEMDWITMDEEIFQNAIDLESTVDTALYGRTTYQMMEGYWPTVPANPSSSKLELQHAAWVEHVHKIVFSTSLEHVTWNNTTLVKDDSAAAIAALKGQPGQDMMIFGSPGLVHAFMREGLIDQYRINVNPVVLGCGIPFFLNVKEMTNLTLLAAKTFRAGVVGLHYQRV